MEIIFEGFMVFKCHLLGSRAMTKKKKQELQTHLEAVRELRNRENKSADRKQDPPVMKVRLFKEALSTWENSLQFITIPLVNNYQK